MSHAMLWAIFWGIVGLVSLVSTICDHIRDMAMIEHGMDPREDTSVEKDEDKTNGEA